MGHLSCLGKRLRQILEIYIENSVIPPFRPEKRAESLVTKPNCDIRRVNPNIIGTLACSTYMCIAGMGKDESGGADDDELVRPHSPYSSNALGVGREACKSS